MTFHISAACSCTTGKVRKNNEDNFYFNGRTLPPKNDGIHGKLTMRSPLEDSVVLGVFDGMGGENDGEIASWLAAETMQRHIEESSRIAESPRMFLSNVCQEMNRAVFSHSQANCSGVMGSTGVMLQFVPDEVYVCNLGDSRAYRLRDRTLMQLSEDHVERMIPPHRTKPGLIQYLGMDEEEIQLDPYIAKGDLRDGDIYLICSDGITDMLSNLEICDILLRHADSARACVSSLEHHALKNGGKDNATAIVAIVQKEPSLQELLMGSDSEPTAECTDAPEKTRISFPFLWKKRKD